MTARPDDPDRRLWFRHLYPDAGPAWLAAIDFGIDVAMLDENLAMTLEERMAQMLETTRFLEELDAARERHGSAK